MDIKLFEVRDRMTFVPVLAIRLRGRSSQEFYLLRRAGYAAEQIADDPPENIEPYILLASLVSGQAKYDPFDWSNRTMQVAHMHLIQNWRGLESGAVVDVEFILGEKPVAKESEAVSYPL